MKVLVIGDSCTDKFIYGECNRICPEAPVPVFNPIEQKSNGGMAKNVFNNLKSLASKWDIDLITNIVFNIDDHQYFPLIYNLSNLDFYPSYDNDLTIKNSLPFPIYSIIFHSVFYKIFNIYGFIIIEFFLIFIFFYLLSSFLIKLGLDQPISILITLLYE